MEKRMEMMSEGDISKALVKFGVPAIIGLIVVAIYNFVDAIFVGDLGTSAMGAASIAFPLSMIIIGLGLLFGTGAASYISRSLGKKDIKEANKTASTAFYGSIILGTIAIVITLFIMEPLLRAFGATDTIMPFAKDYSYIFIGGSLFNIMNITMNNIVRAQGAAKTSMKALILGALLNIILDPIFIYTFNLGIKGAAIATVISQAVSTVLLISFLTSKKSILKISIKSMTCSKKILFEIFKVGLPNFIFQLLSSASMGFINTAAFPHGDAAISAMGIVNRIFALGSYVIFGFAKGFQPLAGFNFGARKFDRLKAMKDTSIKWTTIFCLSLAVIQLIFAGPVVRLFSDDPNVIPIAMKALRAYSILFPFFGFLEIYKTVYLALGKATEGSILSLARQGMFLIPTVHILPNFIGLDGVMFSQPIADALTIILTFVLSINLNSYINKLVNPDLTNIGATEMG